MVPLSEILVWSLAGVLFGAVISWIPGFHIFNIMALLVAVFGVGELMPVQAFPFFAIGAIVAYAYVSAISSVYFSVADESAVFLLFPTQRYLLLGRGHEAVLLYLIGAVAGTLILVLSALFIFPKVLPPIYQATSPYITYFLTAIVVFMFMSEWPKEGDRGKTPLQRLWLAWRQILGGMLVFFLSGVLGFAVMNTNLLPSTSAYTRLTPMFIGFFGMSWVLLNILSNPPMLPQKVDDKVESSVYNTLKASFGGALGGTIAAVYPIITGGMGALIAGHITSQRGDDAFIISQGVNRVIYYVGAFTLLFLPNLRLTRGAAAWLVSSVYTPKSYAEYLAAIGVILLSAGISFVFTYYLSRLIAKSFTVVHIRKLSYVVAVVLIVISYVLTGPMGVLVLFVSTAIGMMAAAFNTRRSYCLGGLVLPVLISMTGHTGEFMHLLGLG
ncbi:tripartite tricarboxylate transporter permease [Thermococcus sp. AM4]|uniref:tripartite tricarboxylate transporter permease n=1 Tax=Thermococcus sp. (strain AM4) TaxID=246969 RepID=UPI0001871368|nr:integral membrane protein [Thermococcus sp. AM4]